MGSQLSGQVGLSSMQETKHMCIKTWFMNNLPHPCFDNHGQVIAYPKTTALLHGKLQRNKMDVYNYKISTHLHARIQCTFIPVICVYVRLCFLHGFQEFMWNISYLISFSTVPISICKHILLLLILLIECLFSLENVQ